MFRTTLKRVTAVTLTFAMGATMLFGCGSKDNNNTSEAKTELTTADSVNDKVLSVCGDEVYEDELMVYAFTQLLDGQVLYNDVIDKESDYKDKIISAIQETKIAYKMSVKDNMEFTDEDKASEQEFIDNFRSTVGADVLKAYNISDELVVKVFDEYCRAKKYTNDVSNSIGKTLHNKYLEEYGQYTFQKVYVMSFPKVETEDGQPKKVDGNTVKLSDEELAKVKANAEAAAAEVNGGAAPKDVAEKYQVADFSEETLTTSGFNGVVTDFNEGQCSNVLENDNCYYTITLTIKDDKEDMEMYAYTMAQTDAETELTNKKAEWKNEVSDSDVTYPDDFWEKFSLKSVAELLHDKGLLIDSSSLSGN